MEVIAPPVFDERERAENDARKARLFELICSTEALALVGSGCSTPAGYASWDSLLEKLERLADECAAGFQRDAAGKANDPVAYAERIRQHIFNTEHGREHYLALLYREFRPGGAPLPLHDRLVSLPFRGILTTNFDGLLETVLDQVDEDHVGDHWLLLDPDSSLRVSEFFLSLSNRHHRRIAHLHGRYEPPPSIILTEADYRKHYGISVIEPGINQPEVIGSPKIEWTLGRKVLWSILATRCVVFIGFGLRDKYLMRLLDLVTVDLWRWGEPTHFAVMPISRDDAADWKIRAETFRRKYGVDVVFYENPDSTFTGLYQLLEEAAAQCGGLTSDWLESTTRKMLDRLRRYEH